MGKGLSSKQDLSQGITHWLNPQLENAIQVEVTILLHSQLPNAWFSAEYTVCLSVYMWVCYETSICEKVDGCECPRVLQSGSRVTGIAPLLVLKGLVTKGRWVRFLPSMGNLMARGSILMYGRQSWSFRSAALGRRYLYLLLILFKFKRAVHTNRSSRMAAELQWHSFFNDMHNPS